MAASCTSEYASVFNAGCVRDTGLALFLLPHIVYDLLSDRRHSKLVQAEIMKVFEYSNLEQDSWTVASTESTEWQLCVQVAAHCMALCSFNVL